MIVSSWHKLLLLLAFGLGAGKLPLMPGTFGTLVALPLYWLMQPLLAWQYLLLLGLMFMVGIYICQIAEKLTGIEDNPSIVWDEIVGYLLGMFLLPVGYMWVLVAFLLFRFFDIYKPWPIRIIDHKYQGGLGIMLDDVLAGVYTWFSCQLLAYLIH